MERKGEVKMDNNKNNSEVENEEKMKNNEEELDQENDTGNDSNSEENNDDKNSSKSNKNDEGKNKGKSFSQAQVNRMMTREKNQGRNAAYKEMGIDPKDTNTINMIKAFVESQKTDEQKAAEKQIEEQTKINEANQRALVAEAKAEAMVLGAKKQYVDDIVTLAMSKMSDDTDLVTIMGELKTKYPVWFGESSDDNEDEDNDDKKVGQKGTGSSVKNNKLKNKSEYGKDFGARLATQRKAGSKKSSYWGRK